MKLLSIGDVFLSCFSQPVSSWLELLGLLSSMIQLVPGGRLLTRSLTPAASSSSVGSNRSVSAGRVVAGNPRRSFLVARPRSLSARRFLWSRCPLSSSYGPTPWTWAWGLTWTSSSLQACGLRKTSSARSMHGSSWRSRVLSSGLLHFLPVPQWQSSPEPRRDSFFFSELHRSEDSPLGGGSVFGDFPTVYNGESQCASGRSFSPKPGLGLLVDAEAGGLQGFMQEMVGVNRPVCNVSKSQLFLIFFSLPHSQCYVDGCSSSKLEWVAGVCFSSLVSHSGGFEEAPVTLWSSTDHRGSILASEAVVSGSSGSFGRRPGRSSTVQ